MGTLPRVQVAALLVAAVCMCAVRAAEPASSTAQTLTLEQRLQRLQDESEIRKLLDEYMHLLRARDWDNYVKLFAKDGELDIVEGVLKGHDAIRTRMANASARMAAAAQGRPPRASADLLTNVSVDVQGDSATASCRFTFISEDGAGGFRVTGSGLYLDTWIREAGLWKIKRRAVKWDLLAGQNSSSAADRTD
jgi:ketosteroid isomerase-like protein